MLSKVYLGIFVCLMLAHGKQAEAKIEVGVEPYLGYSEFSYRANSVADQKYGTVLGGKGGVFVTNKLWLALDYHLGGPYNLEKNNNEYLNRMWGVGAGLRNPGKTRFWIGYYYDAVIDDIERNVLFKGTAFKMSGGFGFDSKLYINLEYCVQNYTEIRSSSFSFPAELKVSVLFLSISSPISLN